MKTAAIDAQMLHDLETADALANLTPEDFEIAFYPNQLPDLNIAAKMIRAERMEYQVARTGRVVESVSFDIAVQEFEAGGASAPAVSA